MADLDEQVRRAERVVHLMSNPDLQRAFLDVHEAILNKMAMCPLRDTEGLVNLRMMLEVLKNVRESLEKAIRDGKAAAVLIEKAANPNRMY